MLAVSGDIAAEMQLAGAGGEATFSAEGGAAVA